MQDILIVVDMQNDFIDGALGTPEAVGIVPKVAAKIISFPGRVIFTRDTHGENYLDTQEGRRLPVRHCVRGTRGWQICSKLEALRCEKAVDKPTFGSAELAEMLLRADGEEKIATITLVGLCTDICVISNALIIKAFLPEATVRVVAACCAGFGLIDAHVGGLWCGLSDIELGLGGAELSKSCGGGFACVGIWKKTYGCGADQNKAGGQSAPPPPGNYPALS